MFRIREEPQPEVDVLSKTYAQLTNSKSHVLFETNNENFIKTLCFTSRSFVRA